MKHLTGFLALFLFIVLPLSAADLSDLTYTTTGGEVTITDCRAAARGELVIPDTIEGNPVTSIGENAFENCRSLTSITISDSVTSIGDDAFVACASLTSITIGNSVTSIGDWAFAFCESLTSISIPDGVTSIGNGAFYVCTSLISITIPYSVTSIGNGAFTDCISLTTIEVGAENVNYTDVNGVLFNKEKTLLHTYPAGKTGANYLVPDSVTSIGGGAFFEGTSLTSITIPDSVTSIGEAAFHNCSSLTSITIGDGVTSIGDRAFYKCTSLTSITIPDSVTSIGGQAFEQCPAAIEIRPVTQNQLAAQLAAVTAERDAAIAERDARPTAEALVAVEAERDAILSDIQLAYDEVNAATGGAAEEDLIAVGPASSATIFDLVWTNSEDSTDTIAMTIEFPEGTVANPVEFDFGTSIQGSVLTIDYLGSVTVINEPRIVFNSPVELDFSQELMGQNDFGTVAGVPRSGDFNLFGVEVPEGTFNGQNYFTLGAPDGSEYILTSMLAPVTSRFSSLELNPLTELYSSLVATNEDAIAERDAAIAERDARPTAEQLAAVEAERDARFTEDQIRALSADYTIGLNDAGNVQMKFNLFESTDLSTFAPLTVNPDSVSVVDGSICLEFAPEDRAAFFRFSVE